MKKLGLVIFTILAVFLIFPGKIILADINEFPKAEIKMSRDGHIIQVMHPDKNKRIRYTGDVFYGYKKLDKIWAHIRITSKATGRKVELIFFFKNPADKVPFYTKGIKALYIDEDPGEELIVVDFEDGTNQEVKNEWTKKAVKWIESRPR